MLVRRGFVIPQPEKRPKSSLRRFAAAFPNECWQIDATEWALADLTIVWIINVVDDHSRLAVASRAVPSASSQAAWATFSDGCSQWGVPWRCLSDNGLCFSGKLRNMEVFFEVQLRAAGIRPVTARPYHPQTCGKVERFQQTLKRWLRAHGPFERLHDLQAAVDAFTSYYNHQRPHRGIGRVTPIERWQATPRVANPGHPLPTPPRRTRTQVNPDGVLRAGPYMIGVGKEHAGTALFGLRRIHCDRPAITVSGRGAPELAGIDRHRRDTLTAVDRARVGVIPVTSPAWTLLDLAGVLELTDAGERTRLGGALDDVLVRKLVA